MTGRLSTKVALISGAARGMGASHARVFVEQGASVVVADLLADEAEALAASLGPAAVAATLDVTDESSWRAAVTLAEERFGGLDILVNNAGIVTSSPIESTPLAEYRKVIEVNQFGVFLGMQAAIGAMRRRGGGSIVNIASIDGMVAMANVASYISSKFAVRGLTKTAALELAVDAIRVNAICPGAIDTTMTAARTLPDGSTIDPKVGLARVPLGRVGTPREVSLLAVYLASDESSFCTGSDFVIDGGWLSGPMEQMAPILGSGA